MSTRSSSSPPLSLSCQLHTYTFSSSSSLMWSHTGTSVLAQIAPLAATAGRPIPVYGCSLLLFCLFLCRSFGKSVHWTHTHNPHNTPHMTTLTDLESESRHNKTVQAQGLSAQGTTSLALLLLPDHRCLCCASSSARVSKECRPDSTVTVWLFFESGTCFVLCTPVQARQSKSRVTEGAQHNNKHNPVS